MFNVDVTKMSSKGQIVIPQDMRKGFAEGDRFIIIKSENQLILKPVNAMKGNFEEDMEFAKRTLCSLEKYERGKFKSVDSKEFLAELEKW
jgi:AbrB family looped-hinge helix DNA binding protein